ncbi:putative transcriptional regulator SLK2 [Drosera capensis]
MPPMGPSWVAGGGLPQSPASSGIFFQGDGPSQNMVNSYFTSSFGNSGSSVPGGGRSNLGPVSGEVHQGVLNSVATSGPSIGASSLVTDANSGFSGGPRLQRSASINTESFARLPASPLSFSSNNISLSGSSIIDGSPNLQQNSQPDTSSQYGNQNQRPFQQGASSATSLPAGQAGQASLPLGPRLAGNYIQNGGNFGQMHKKPRLDVKQDEILQHQLFQQLLQRHDVQVLSHNPQYQAYVQQQQRLRQQQYLPGMPQMQQGQMPQQHQQEQLKSHLQQQGIQQMTSMKNQYDSSGVCARRLMQYLYHQRQRPQENTIAYWRKFVAEYYAPCAKKRWCLSLYENFGQHALGAFPQAAMASCFVYITSLFSKMHGTVTFVGPDQEGDSMVNPCWLYKYNLMLSFHVKFSTEATYEVLPRLNEIKFSSGVLDELLFLDWPRERRFPSGMMVLEYGKAVQESVYEQLRIIREGQLRIIFTQDLKIFSWEFCARRHEELLPRRLVAPQVHQLLQVVQKCQSTISDAGPEGVSSQDIQASSNLVVNAGRQLAKSLDLQSLNDLGFSKRYVRCLQIAEVVNNMKDLIDFCTEAKVGPIEGLKNYPRRASTSKIEMQKLLELEQMAALQGLPTDRNTLSKLMALHSAGLNHFGNINDPASRASPSGSASMPFTNYPNMLTRQTSFNTSVSPIQQDPSSSNGNNDPGNILPGSSVQSQRSGAPNPPLASQRPLQFHNRSVIASTSCLPQQNQPTPQVISTNGQALQNQMIQQLLQDMASNNATTVQQPKPEPGAGPSDTGGSVGGHAINSSNCYKVASNNDSSATGGKGGFDQKTSDLPQGQFSDDMISSITDDFLDSGFFNNELDANMGYAWKA